MFFQNLDYARSLLTRVEQEAMHVKLLSRRQDMQADLNRKRELLERLVDRMHDLEQVRRVDPLVGTQAEKTKTNACAIVARGRR